MKQKCIWWTISLPAFSFLAVSCSAQTTGHPPLRELIGQINARYYELYTRGDSAVIDLYTADACLSAPGTPVICGRSALLKDFRDTYATGKIKGVKFATKEIYGDGREYITEDGTWQLIGKNGQVTGTGKYLKLWKKTATGWKIFRDSFNSDSN